jgi:alkylation response protein AidB-like acyl-CoA dehydrogenase
MRWSTATPRKSSGGSCPPSNHVNLRFEPEEEKFRDELRSWLETAVKELPPEPALDDWPARRVFDGNWQKMLYDAGYAGLEWPREYGGRGASAAEQLIYLEEMGRAGAPDVGINFVGLLHAGPTLVAEATPEQKRRYLPPILKGEEFWCQGFSEPDAGSDLAGLRTLAKRDGDEYVVTGQKIWTSRSQAAHFCELLVRTDPEAPKHRGITWLIMPMDLPGIEVRPLRTIQGSSDFAEVFLDNVRIPVGNRVGEENGGWRVAMVTFSFERGTAFVSDLLRVRGLLHDLASLARRIPRRDGVAWDDAGIRRDLGIVASEIEGLWALTLRNVTQAEHAALPQSGSSSFKLLYGETLHRVGDVATRILERAALSLGDLPGMEQAIHIQERLRAFSVTIAAGSSQIQRNILSERVLGLPKER